MYYRKPTGGVFQFPPWCNRKVLIPMFLLIVMLPVLYFHYFSTPSVEVLENVQTTTKVLQTRTVVKNGLLAEQPDALLNENNNALVVVNPKPNPNPNPNLCPPTFDQSSIELISWDPRAFVYHNFMTDEECDYFIAKAIEQGLVRSQVAAGKDGDALSDVRTSFGVFLNPDKTLRKIEERIARWTHIPVENGEQFYFLRYQEGQQYQPHHDYFHEQLPGMERYLGKAGQRTATVLLYLHTPDEGGETIFPHTNKKVPAVRGDALLFWSHTPSIKVDPHSLHGGSPVIRGTKYSATKWMRINRY